jgi:cyclopropane-fatty-acyl-phospholipid synthase
LLLLGQGRQLLEQAEADALEITCARAAIEDGMDILDLGCGWGSLSLWMAERCPASKITSVSNSAPQRAWIEERARERGLNNLRVITADMNHFGTEQRFDRIVSVEMFEHAQLRELFRRISAWLRPRAFFIHIFCHRNSPYAFIDSRPPTG